MNSSIRESAIENAVNEVLQELINSAEKAERLVSNTKYMLWLEEFTAKNHGFSDDSWLYNSEKLSAIDSENVHNLCSFFNGIAKYADNNFLPVYSEDAHESHVYIQFNGIGYEIGVVVGQGAYTYCQRLNIFSDKRFINFNDVVANKKQKNVDHINKQLNKLSASIHTLMDMGVPIKAITGTIEDALSN